MKSPWETAAVGREFSEQTALFQWAAMATSFGLRAANDPLSYKVEGHAKAVFQSSWADQVPQLTWLHAIKNQGHGDAVRGARSAMEGVKAGVSDVFLPVPIGYEVRYSDQVAPFEGGLYGRDGRTYCGLYVELKRQGKNGGASDKQLEFQSDIRDSGYACEICVGWEAARDVILQYLGLT